MSDRHHIGPLADMSETEGRRVVIGELEIALFRRGSRVFAVGDSCPHMGASLSEGFIDGDCVVCPWHGWTFKLENGSSPFEVDAGVPVYRVTIEEGEVYLQIEADTPSCRGPVSGG